MNDLDRTIMLLVAIHLAGCAIAFFIGCFVGCTRERRRWRRVSPRLPNDGCFQRPPPGFRERPPHFGTDPWSEFHRRLNARHNEPKSK